MTEPTPPSPPTGGDAAARARASKRVPILFALIFFVVGGWLLLDALGFNVPDLSRIWPVFLAVGGLASLLDYLVISRRPRSAGQAVFGVGLAIVGFVFSSGAATWRDTLDWLPAVPIIIGLGMLTTWAVAGRKDTGLFTAGLVILSLGLMGLLVRFQFLRDLLPSAQVVWAVALLIVGALVLWRVFNRPA